MTSAEWEQQFRQGDPVAVGKRLHQALEQAGSELGLNPEPSWDDTYEPLQRQYIRAGQILRDQGVITIPGEPNEPDIIG